MIRGKRAYRSQGRGKPRTKTRIPNSRNPDFASPEGEARVAQDIQAAPPSKHVVPDSGERIGAVPDEGREKERRIIVLKLKPVSLQNFAHPIPKSPLLQVPFEAAAAEPDFACSKGMATATLGAPVVAGLSLPSYPLGAHCRDLTADERIAKVPVPQQWRVDFFPALYVDGCNKASPIETDMENRAFFPKSWYDGNILTDGRKPDWGKMTRALGLVNEPFVCEVIQNEISKLLKENPAFVWNDQDENSTLPSFSEAKRALESSFGQFIRSRRPHCTLDYRNSCWAKVLVAARLEERARVLGRIEDPQLRQRLTKIRRNCLQHFLTQVQTCRSHSEGPPSASLSALGEDAGKQAEPGLRSRTAEASCAESSNPKDSQSMPAKESSRLLDRLRESGDGTLPRTESTEPRLPLLNSTAHPQPTMNTKEDSGSLRTSWAQYVSAPQSSQGVNTIVNTIAILKSPADSNTKLVKKRTIDQVLSDDQTRNGSVEKRRANEETRKSVSPSTNDSQPEHRAEPDNGVLHRVPPVVDLAGSSNVVLSTPAQARSKASSSALNAGQASSNSGPTQGPQNNSPAASEWTKSAWFLRKAQFSKKRGSVRIFFEQEPQQFTLEYEGQLTNEAVHEVFQLLGNACERIVTKMELSVHQLQHRGVNETYLASSRVEVPREQPHEGLSEFLKQRAIRETCDKGIDFLAEVLEVVPQYHESH